MARREIARTLRHHFGDLIQPRPEEGLMRDQVQSCPSNPRLMDRRGRTADHRQNKAKEGQQVSGSKQGLDFLTGGRRALSYLCHSLTKAPVKKTSWHPQVRGLYLITIVLLISSISVAPKGR